MNYTSDQSLLDWEQMYREAVIRQSGAATGQMAHKTYPAKYVDPIEQATDDALILELIKRGYAVGRLNENNQLET